MGLLGDTPALAGQARSRISLQHAGTLQDKNFYIASPPTHKDPALQ